MPLKSKAQRRFLQAAAHDPAFARRAEIPSEVAAKLLRKDKHIARPRGQDKRQAKK